MDVLADGFTDNSVAFLIQMFRFWLFRFHFRREETQSYRDNIYRAGFVQIRVNSKKRTSLCL